MRRIYSLVTLLVVFAALSYAQAEKPSLPDPVKFINKFDIVWNVVRAVLTDLEYDIELEDKTGGKIFTKPYEFITGSLTTTEIDKVAVRKNPVGGNLMKARYTVEAAVEIVTPSETLVTIRTRMEALDRELDGKERWVPLDSLGGIEKRILGKISLKLLGNELQFDNKKGFWDKSPQPVDPRRPRPYPTRPPL